VTRRGPGTEDIAVGERVGAVMSADDKTVYLLGYGLYGGQQTPPAPYGMERAVFACETWEARDAALAAEFDAIHDKEVAAGRLPVTAKGWIPPRPVNPMITLDSGDVVWGYECWWGTEDRVRVMCVNKRVVEVPVAELRKPRP
jgi:hypothetical protein